MLCPACMKNYSSCASGERPLTDTFAARYIAYSSSVRVYTYVYVIDSIRARCNSAACTLLARHDRFTFQENPTNKVVPTIILYFTYRYHFTEQLNSFESVLCTISLIIKEMIDQNNVYVFHVRRADQRDKLT